jgi:hypothetical protein
MNKVMNKYRIWDGGSGMSYSTFCDIVDADLSNLSDLTADLMDAEEVAEKEMLAAKAAYDKAVRHHDFVKGNIVSVMNHSLQNFPDVAGKGICFSEGNVVYELRMKDETTVVWDKKEITINHREVN